MLAWTRMRPAQIRRNKWFLSNRNTSTHITHVRTNAHPEYIFKCALLLIQLVSDDTRCSAVTTLMPLISAQNARVKPYPRHCSSRRFKTIIRLRNIKYSHAFMSGRIDFIYPLMRVRFTDNTRFARNLHKRFSDRIKCGSKDNDTTTPNAPGRVAKKICAEILHSILPMLCDAAYFSTTTASLAWHEIAHVTHDAVVSDQGVIPYLPGPSQKGESDCFIVTTTFHGFGKLPAMEMEMEIRQ